MVEFTKFPALKNAPQCESYPYDIFTVGEKCHVSGYTDIEPATVIEVSKNGKKVTVQIDDAKLAEGEKPNIISGGFAGHCTNQRGLKWDITRNENGSTRTFSLRKWRGRYVWTEFKCTPNGRMNLAEGWMKFYDYNF